jgi:hypothetical protein
MASIHQKRDSIQRHEAAFADRLSAAVIERPKLSVWMILIPIIFVSYFSQLRRYAQGRKEFTKNYLQSKQQALDLAFEALASGAESDIDHLARLTDVPDDIRPLQAEVQKVLVGHFLALLRADGEAYDALVRAAYSDRTAYLLFLNRLNKAENAVYASLTAKLTEEGASSIVATVERESERLRRREAERVFP